MDSIGRSIIFFFLADQLIHAMVAEAMVPWLASALLHRMNDYSLVPRSIVVCDSKSPLFPPLHCINQLLSSEALQYIDNFLSFNSQDETVLRSKTNHCIPGALQCLDDLLNFTFTGRKRLSEVKHVRCVPRRRAFRSLTRCWQRNV